MNSPARVFSGDELRMALAEHFAPAKPARPARRGHLRAVDDPPRVDGASILDTFKAQVSPVDLGERLGGVHTASGRLWLRHLDGDEDFHLESPSHASVVEGETATRISAHGDTIRGEFTSRGLGMDTSGGVMLSAFDVLLAYGPTQDFDWARAIVSYYADEKQVDVDALLADAERDGLAATAEATRPPSAREAMLAPASLGISLHVPLGIEQQGAPGSWYAIVGGPGTGLYQWETDRSNSKESQVVAVRKTSWVGATVARSQYLQLGTDDGVPAPIIDPSVGAASYILAIRDAYPGQQERSYLGSWPVGGKVREKIAEVAANVGAPIETPGDRATCHRAVEALMRVVPEQEMTEHSVYASTGIELKDGTHRFILPGGSISAAGYNAGDHKLGNADGLSSLDRHLTRVALHSPAQTADDWKAGLSAVGRFLALTPGQPHAVVGLAQVLQAPLPLGAFPALMFVGSPGSGKSEFAASVASLVADNGGGKEHATAALTSTRNASGLGLRRTILRASGLVTFVDEFRPHALDRHQAAEVEAVLSELIQSGAGAGGEAKAKPGGVADTTTARTDTSLLLTGEVRPGSGDAVAQRTTMLAMDGNTLDYAGLVAWRTQHSGAARSVIAAHYSGLMRRLDDPATNGVRGLRVALDKQISDLAAGRGRIHTLHAATRTVGVVQLLRTIQSQVVDAGLLTWDEVLSLLAIDWQGLGVDEPSADRHSIAEAIFRAFELVADDNVREVAADAVPLRILTTAVDVVEAGQYHLTNEEGGAPAFGAEQFGWQATEQGQQARGTRLGMVARGKDGHRYAVLNTTVLSEIAKRHEVSRAATQKALLGLLQPLAGGDNPVFIVGRAGAAHGYNKQYRGAVVDLDALETRR